MREEQNGYCPSCKRSQPRIQLCENCAGRRDGGKYMGDNEEKPPKVVQRPWKSEN